MDGDFDVLAILQAENISLEVMGAPENSPIKERNSR